MKMTSFTVHGEPQGKARPSQSRKWNKKNVLRGWINEN